MIAMLAMQAAVHEIVGMLAVRHRFVPAVRPVDMPVRMMRLIAAAVRMLGVDGNHMLVDMIPVRVMEMAVMQIIDMPLMPDRLVAAAGPVLVRMVAVHAMIAHISSLPVSAHPNTALLTRRCVNRG
jgi:hypothetical protein